MASGVFDEETLQGAEYGLPVEDVHFLRPEWLDAAFIAEVQAREAARGDHLQEEGVSSSSAVNTDKVDGAAALDGAVEADVEALLGDMDEQLHELCVEESAAQDERDARRCVLLLHAVERFACECRRVRNG